MTSNKYSQSSSSDNFTIQSVTNAFHIYILLICDKSVKTQNLAIFELLVQKETLAGALLRGTVS